uniref:Protein tyrosine phosphatase receptor type Na n=1 Tax=Oreochromis niloticus TaxID=8128 RepID=A0A669CFZ0_ORENI
MITKRESCPQLLYPGPGLERLPLPNLGLHNYIRIHVCISDGLFGQCRSSKQDQVQYQVSVPVLKRMQEVLKQLMLEGETEHNRELKYNRYYILSLPTQHRYQDEVERSLMGSAGAYARPSSRSQTNQRERERDRQLLLEALSLYLASAQPSYRHRGAPSMVPLVCCTLHSCIFTVFSDPTCVSLCLCVASVVGPALTFRIRQNEHNMTAAEVAAKAVSEKNFLESETGLKIVQTGVGERTDARGLPQVTRVSQGSSGTVITLVSMAVVGGVLVLAMAVACLRHYAQQVNNGKLGLGPEGGAETHFDYQELCRQHMASKSSLCRQDCVGGVTSSISGPAVNTGAGGRRGTDTSRVSSVSSQFSDGPQHSPSSTHSSTPSWSEEPAQSNMDISTGHMILAYMEDHLRNKDRLQKEWEALCSYQAEPSSVAVAQSADNMDKNRHAEALPYDHSRVKLKTDVNPNKQDYINASIIFDHDPRQPSYIATQGPLPHTVADFWQMVWENGCTVIVMMTALVEDGEKQCERYWPDEGSSLYHIYEVNLVSEHIWCKDFLVRSFYLKNVQTQETRTLTQFHLLSWPADGIPTSTRPLLDFRRKVNKCYRGRSCPIIVHCGDGTGRTGTYILIDMVLNRMAKGVKEIDIAATLEHIRDQRPGLVRTKDQFEFALTAVAEEVNAILKALPQ